MSDRDHDFVGSPGYRSNPDNGVPTLRREQMRAKRHFRVVALVYGVAIVAVVVWFNWPTIRAWLP